MSRLLASLAAALVWTTAAVAQADETILDRAEAMIEAAMTEHRLFQTCLALVPRSGSDLVWTGLVELTLEPLRQQQGAEQLIARLEASLEDGALLLPDETSFAELRAFCSADPDWMIRLNRLEFIQLDREIEALFQTTAQD